MAVMVVVAGILWNQDRLLICQRKLTHSFPGKWEFPGGKIESGEQPQAALRRELSEELGIDATIGKFVWQTEHQYPGRMPVSLRFFEVSHYRGTIQNRVFEQIVWSPIQELQRYDFLEADRPLIGKILAREVLPPDS
jgi:8-oxo-dGTP diphosphatase